MNHITWNLVSHCPNVSACPVHQDASPHTCNLCVISTKSINLTCPTTYIMLSCSHQTGTVQSTVYHSPQQQEPWRPWVHISSRLANSTSQPDQLTLLNCTTTLQGRSQAAFHHPPVQEAVNLPGKPAVKPDLTTSSESSERCTTKVILCSLH